MAVLLRLSRSIAGAFAIVLGLLHFFFPRLLDFRGAIPLEGPSLRPLRLFIYRYHTTRHDVRGIAWVMNHCVSYVIVSIGLADLFLYRWLDSVAGRGLALWIAGFYSLRAMSQLYLGRRRGDWLILGGFSTLALFHGMVALL